MLNARDIAIRWDVNPRTVLKLHREGKLPGVRISSKVIRFREEDVKAYEASCVSQHTEESSASTTGMNAATLSAAVSARMIG